MQSAWFQFPILLLVKTFKFGIRSVWKTIPWLNQSDENKFAFHLSSSWSSFDSLWLEVNFSFKISIENREGTKTRVLDPKKILKSGSEF